MFRNIFRGMALLAAVVLIAACSGCSMSTEQTMYDIGLKALKQDPALSKTEVTAAPRSKCTFYIGKSAASMEMPYSVSGPGATEGTYVVWLNRIGTRWELDRSSVAPKRQ